MVQTRCMTYNHAPYILEAMNGFCMQKTTFPFVNVIVDDDSKDGEPEVIEKYLQEHFNLQDSAVARREETDDYRLVFAQHKTNKNCYFVMLLLKYNHHLKKDKYPYFAEWTDASKYIALCEGDDYWTDPLKLQKQVDILEADESLMLCCTSCSVVDKDGKLISQRVQEPVVKDNKQGRYNLRDFFRDQHQYPTLSVLYRNTHRGEIRAKHAHTVNAFLGDWTLWICVMIYGDMYYLDEVTCAYRINPTSVTHTVNRVARAKAHRDICLKVADVLPEEYKDIADDLRDTSWVWISLIFAYKAERRYFAMLGALFMSIIKCPDALCSTWKKSMKRRRMKA